MHSDYDDKVFVSCLILMHDDNNNVKLQASLNRLLGVKDLSAFKNHGYIVFYIVLEYACASSNESIQVGWVFSLGTSEKVLDTPTPVNVTKIIQI